MQFELLVGGYLAVTVFLALAFGERLVDVLASVAAGDGESLTDWE